MNRKWTEAELEYIRLNAEKTHDKEIAKQLEKIVGREISLQAVRKQRQRMGLKKEGGRGKCCLKGRG